MDMVISIKFGGERIGLVRFIKTSIPEVIIIEPSVFRDQRGYFLKVIIKGYLKQTLGR